jgi:SAM-dependent methyltransferase
MASDETVQSTPDKEQLFYSNYGRFTNALEAQVRQETFGEDIGQFGWLTADEFRRFFEWLDLIPGSDALDIACGTGGPALFMARTTGSHVAGMDISEEGIRVAKEMAQRQGMADQVEFRHGDAGQRLPFDDASFDAIICIDAINHLYNRMDVLMEWYRVLRPGGRILFTDPITVTGMITRDEMIARSGSMGLFVFTPLGVDEHLIEAAGFVEVLVEDGTPNIAMVSGNWVATRANHEADLREIEGEVEYENMQNFLTMVYKLSSERRLSRLVYVARKPA